MAVDENADLLLIYRVMPEDVGMAAAQLLCDEVAKGGCVDSTHQSLVFLLMTLCPEDVSRVRVGQLTEYRCFSCSMPGGSRLPVCSMRTLRHIRDFFGVTFKINLDPDSDTTLMACRGVGYHNISRKTS